MEPLAVYGLNVFDDLVRRVHVKKQTFMMHEPVQFSVNTFRQGNFILAEICWIHRDNDHPFCVVGRGIAKRSAWDLLPRIRSICTASVSASPSSHSMRRW